jgi:predicted RNA-binding protein (virulence factor B family)
MNDNQVLLDKINTEHRYMQVGDAVPVNMFDDHDSEIVEHTKQLEILKSQENDNVLQSRSISLLEAHIALHKEYKESKL